jgi:hypothetical protein
MLTALCNLEGCLEQVIHPINKYKTSAFPQPWPERLLQVAEKREKIPLNKTLVTGRNER